MDRHDDMIILYPVFLKCCQYTSDKFWRKIFDDFAYGKCPYGVYFNKDVLCCKGKKGQVNCLIDDNIDDKSLYEKIREILVNNMGILSPNDRITQEKIFVEFSEPENETTWNGIKKKNKKDLLLELFSIEMRQKFNLGIQEARFLHSFIKSALMFKTILPSDIVIENGRISEIRGINIKDKKIIFDIDLYDFVIDEKETRIENKRKMSDSWDTYINELQRDKN